MASTVAPKDLLTYNTDAELFGFLSEALKNGPLSLMVTHVAKSGMSRTIRVFGMRNGRIEDMSREVARLTGHRWSEKGVHIGGCGMDMGFALMDSLGWAWVKFAYLDVDTRKLSLLSGRFANGGTRWDGDNGELDSPWPRTNRLWEWL